MAIVPPARPGYPQGARQYPYPAQQQQRQLPQQQIPTGYWQPPKTGYAIPGSPGGYSGGLSAEKKTDPKKVLYLVAIILLVVGAFLVYRGFTSTPPKISIKLEGLGAKESAIVGIVCKPCGSVQETSLQQVVGKDNYKGTTKTQFGTEIMIAKANGDQVFTLSDKDWVRYIDRIE